MIGNLKNFMKMVCILTFLMVFPLFSSVAGVGSQSSSVLVPSVDGYSVFMSLVCHVIVACTGTSDCSVC